MKKIAVASIIIVSAITGGLAQQEDLKATENNTYISTTEGTSNWLNNYNQTQKFGAYQDFDTSFNNGQHYGIDFEMPENTPVYAVADGTITDASYSSQGGGNQITLKENGKQDYQWYMHLNNFNVSSGDKVQAGEKIGESGSTGFSTGPHLHFQRMDGGLGNEYAEDPQDYLDSL